MTGIDVYEENRAKKGDILAPAVYHEKNEIRSFTWISLIPFRQPVRQTAAALVVFYSDTFIPIMYYKTLTFIQMNGSYASSKKCVDFLVLATSVTLMETSTKI